MDLVLSTTEFWNFLDQLRIRHDGQNLTSLSPAPSVYEEQQTMTTSEGVNQYPSDTGDYIRSSPLDTPSGRDEIEQLFRSFSEDGAYLVHAVDAHGGSGGYAEHLCHYLAQYLSNNSPSHTRSIPYKQGRNIDIAEVELSSFLDDLNEHDGAVHSSNQPSVSQVSTGTCTCAPTGKTMSDEPAVTVTDLRKLKFARVYGFRNIQTVVLNLKRAKLNVDFIEVMACPSGCVNGGGQLKSSERESAVETKDRVHRVSTQFHRRHVRSVDDSPLVRLLYEENNTSVISDIKLKGDSDMNPQVTGTDSVPVSILALSMVGPLTATERRELFHTRYHAVPKMDVLAPLAVKW